MKRNTRITRILSMAAVAAIGLSVALTGTACQETAGMKSFQISGVTMQFEASSGLLKTVKANKAELKLDGIYADIGLDNVSLLDQTTSGSLGELNTWSLPEITSRNSDYPEGYTVDSIKKDGKTVVVRAHLEHIRLTYTYYPEKTGLRMAVTIGSDSESRQELSGVTLAAKGMRLGEQASFEFPGNFPCDVYNLGSMDAWKTVTTEYSNPIVHFTREGGTDVNVLFINQVEKWGTGVLKNNEGNAGVYTVSATESYLEAGATVTVGDMYIQLCGKDDPYRTVTDLYTEKGWIAPGDGISVGPMYSCHPYGTMDANFNKTQTLQEYAAYLDTLRDIGIENVWLLPIFLHPGTSVYASIDQEQIDDRYGGDAGAKAFIDRAHELGMRVLFDYVPHGPAPSMPLAVKHPDWCSKKRDGTNQIEWDCVSFDYNNEGYLDYTMNMAKKHAAELGVDGARIDCAMGGLPNWSPTQGNRPSASSLQAGVKISKAIREGLQAGGRTPVNMPENFHPVPFYAAYTDLFYDMPLYRTIFHLRESGADDVTFASTLARWLSLEQKTSPVGQVKLRYLDNHDTVSWVWDSQRPATLYGADKAKALWALLSLIDGVPMVYQGDEDPTIHGRGGPNLTAFFKELFAARTACFGEANDYGIEYILGDSSPVIAFTRSKDKDVKTVLINLSADAQTCTLDKDAAALYAVGASVSGKQVTLNGYGFIVAG